MGASCGVRASISNHAYIWKELLSKNHRNLNGSNRQTYITWGSLGRGSQELYGSDWPVGVSLGDCLEDFKWDCCGETRATVGSSHPQAGGLTLCEDEKLAEHQQTREQACTHFSLLWTVDAMWWAVWSPCLTSLQGHTLTWMASQEEPFIPQVAFLRWFVYSNSHETRAEQNQETVWVKMGKGLRGYFLQMINRHI